MKKEILFYLLIYILICICIFTKFNSGAFLLFIALIILMIKNEMKKSKKEKTNNLDLKKNKIGLLILLSVFFIPNNVFASDLPSLQNFNITNWNYRYVSNAKIDYINLGKRTLASYTGSNKTTEGGIVVKKNGSDNYYVIFMSPDEVIKNTNKNTNEDSPTLETYLIYKAGPNNALYYNLYYGSRSKICIVELDSVSYSPLGFSCGSRSELGSSLPADIDIIQSKFPIYEVSYDGFNGLMYSGEYNKGEKFDSKVCTDYDSLFGNQYNEITVEEVPSISNIFEYKNSDLYPYHTLVKTSNDMYYLIFTKYKLTTTTIDNTCNKFTILNLTNSNGVNIWEDEDSTIYFYNDSLKSDWLMLSNKISTGAGTGFVNLNNQSIDYFLMLPNRSVFNPEHSQFDNFVESLELSMPFFIHTNWSYDKRYISLSAYTTSNTISYGFYSNYTIENTEEGKQSYTFTQRSFSGNKGGNFDNSSTSGSSNVSIIDNINNNFSFPTSLGDVLGSIPKMLGQLGSVFAAIGTMFVIFFQTMPPFITSGFALLFSLGIIILIVKILK